MIVRGTKFDPENAIIVSRRPYLVHSRNDINFVERPHPQTFQESGQAAETGGRKPSLREENDYDEVFDDGDFGNNDYVSRV